MTADATTDTTTAEHEAALWRRVCELWELFRARDAEAIRRLLHPRYSGWVTGQDAPHGLDAALRSVGPETPPVLRYALTPRRVTVFDGEVGVVHYAYVAEIETPAGAPGTIRGRWTEVYRRVDGDWIMLSATGGPDGQR